MNRAAHFCLHVILMVASPLCTAFATAPDTFSRVVSFQYLDSLNEPGSNTKLTSLMVSYQYYEWPGADLLALKNSQPVSYFFSSSSVFTLQPQSQVAKVGTNVTFTAQADGVAPLSYQWRFNQQNIPGAAGPTLTRNNVQFANTGIYSIAVTNSYGTATSNDAGLTVYDGPAVPQPNVPTQTVATQSLSLAQATKPTTPISTQLRWFNASSGQFVNVPQPIPSGKMAIVLTHGWNSGVNSPNWPTSMASALIAAGYGSNANIFAWDWHGVASLTTVDPAPVAIHIVSEGSSLGAALMDALGPTYSMPIHFMGHSFGTGVNCTAANYVHGDKRPRGDARPTSEKYASYRTHMTLFDEAELATAVKGMHVICDAILGGFDDYAVNDSVQQRKDFWLKVIPDHWGWIDNYVSEVGFSHRDAVNVCLFRNTFLNIPSDFFVSHGYAWQWYQATIGNPTRSSMGHRWSFERGTLFTGSAASSFQGPMAPNSYLQSLNPYQTEMLLNPISFSVAQSASVVLYPSGLALIGLNAVGNKIETVYLNGIQYAGNMAASFFENFSVPSGQPVYLGTAGSTAAFFAQPGQFSPSSSQANWDLNFSLTPSAAQPQQLTLPMKATAVTAAGTNVEALTTSDVGDAANAAYTIMPIHVPLEAVGMSFEYKISNAAVDDFMTMGIGTDSLFSLDAKYLEDGQWNGTPVFQISDRRNQDVQFVFAMLGSSGPPTGTLSIRNIRFYIPPRPSLSTDAAGGQMTLSWPISAQDWTMETTGDLSQPNPWQPILVPPLDLDLSHTMTFDITGPRQFFRLRK